jgi:predicted transcriptional regulator
MLKEAYHPNAYLANLRNISLGLRARTKILNALERSSGDAKTIAEKASVRYGVVMHHLKLLQSEGIVRREGGKPSVWTLTGAGQKRLVSTN